MTKLAPAKGTWFHRFAIRAFTVVFGLLVFWLLDFVVEDIRALDGPKLADIEAKFVSRELLVRRADLAKQIEAVSEQIKFQTDKQRLAADSSRNLQQTITQLTELQKLGLQKNTPLPEAEQANFNRTLNSFLEVQRRYQELGETTAAELDRKRKLTADLEQLDEQLRLQRIPAQEEYNLAFERHRMRSALLQLGIFVPLLAFAAIVLIKKRAGLYSPLWLAFGTATLVQIALTMHEYFPSRYFKYILIVALLIAIGALLVHFIRLTAFPKIQSLFKQYREAYERFLCPVCEYPIRTGPRRFLFWTRRTVNKVIVPLEHAEHDEVYTCPSCGHELFEKCTKCEHVRHAMLPHCAHCGDEKTFTENVAVAK